MVFEEHSECLSCEFFHGQELLQFVGEAVSC